ncbi:MAG: hypothetical protein HW404_1459, partial [Anaerolineales bacterium]|nr:hypothetical protein [Anaerolineales bacterium]
RHDSLLGRHSTIKQATTTKKHTDSVDAFMAKLKHPLRGQVQAVRETIMNVNEGIAEEIKWAAPTFSYKGYLASFNLHAKQHVASRLC